MKKIFAILLLISVLAASLASCRITPYVPSESSSVSDSTSSSVSEPPKIEDDNAAVVYKDAVIGKRLFKLVAALQKGIAEYAYKIAAGIDFEANPDYWDLEYSNGVTFAQNTLQSAVDRCKELAVIKQLCDTAGIAEPSDVQKQAYFDKLAENYDSKADFVKILNDLGITDNEIYQYYSICARGIDLKKKLTGEGGALELSEHEADEWFRQYVEANYVKADMLFISFYEDDGKTKVIDPSFTDSDATDYFVNNYLKCRYIKYSNGASALADACLADLQSGKMTIEQKLGESSDSESVMLLVYGDKFHDDIQKLSDGEYAKIETDDAIYIVCRASVSSSDITTAIKNNCLWLLTCNKLTEDSEPLLDDIKNGRVNYDSAPIGKYLDELVFDEDDYGKEIFKNIKYDLLVGECDVTCTAGGVYIYTKCDVAGSCDDKRDEAVSNHIDEIYDEHIASFVGSSEVFDSVTESVSIREIKSLLLV